MKLKHIKTDKESLIRYLLIAAFLLVSGAVCVVYYRDVLPVLGTILRFIGVLISPFAFAWLTAVITKPLTGFFADKLRLPRTVAVLLSMLLFFAVIAALIILFVSVLVDLLGSIAAFAGDVSQISSTINDFLSSIYDKLGLNPDQVTSVIDQAKEKLISFASNAAGWLVDVAKATPEAFVWLFVTLVAVFYWCRDEKKIVPVLCRVLPRDMREDGSRTYFSFSKVLGQFIRAYMILIAISFVLCIIGFYILKVKAPFAIALFTAMLDIIPVLGPGTLLVPWAVVCFITGNVNLGIGLLILYVVITVIRYILQPKVMGDSMGMHPLAALAAIFIGMKLFGIVGLILGPIILAVLIGVYRSRKNPLGQYALQEAELQKEDDTEA
ncbi:MAG: sporulation integral membrane protein YtvI [Firmicutes bacterium]|nr:sporulation integral membrane protein YtvI [Bacillota bacterium]